MNVTLKQLKVFITTAQLKKLTDVANELCISQSAVSQSLKEFELVLGYQVFTRVKRELKINEQGLRLLPKAQQMLALQYDIQHKQEKALAEIHVSASVTIGCYLLPRLIAQFSEKYSHITVKLDIDNSAGVIEKLEQGQAHFGLIETPLSHQYLQIEPCKEDKLKVFCSAEDERFNHNKPMLTVKELEKLPWILREHGSGTRSVFTFAMQQLGCQFNSRLDLTRQEAIKQAVKAKLGVGVLSQLAIKHELINNEFKEIETPLNLTRQFSFVHSPHFQHDKNVKRFYQFLKQPSSH
jgi:DNA-binding transcriptional LysR family regulator